MKESVDILCLCDEIRKTSLQLHGFLRQGHLEKVYENGLAHRLRMKNIGLIQQFPLQVMDRDGFVLGEFVADLFVEDCLMVEIKACKALVNEHVAQLLGYLRACRLEHGLLINFGSPKLEIRKYVLTPADIQV